MIRTYYLTVEGERDEILERHGNIMKQFRSLHKGKLDLTIGFDEHNMKKEAMLNAGRLAKTGGSLALDGAKKGLTYLKEATGL